MAVHNNDDILMLHYEDLPDGDKGIIIKAIEEFQNKCLLSYTKTRDNIIVQKFPLPRVLLHGQTNTNEAKDMRFFKEVVDKSIRDAMSSHNEAFVDVFHNALKEAIHGFPVGQGGPAYYNILDLLTQGTPRGPIKLVPAIKKQHRLVVVMSRQFKVHLNKLKELLQIKHSTILDHQYSMCNSRWGKVITR
jgi:hypothetical protein